MKGKDGYLAFWGADKDPRELWREVACKYLLDRNFTEFEWQHYMGDRPYEKTCPQYPAGELTSVIY